MTIDSFFEKFDQFADAPNAVAKMRELVLQLAVQGRLVRQQEDDEPAVMLVRNAVLARKKLVTEKCMRAEEQDLSFLDQTNPKLPLGWALSPLSIYVGIIMGQSPPSSANRRKMPSSN